MAHLATLSALALAFGWLHRRSLGWLVETLGHADHRFNVAVLSLTVVFVARRGLRLEPPRAHQPQRIYTRQAAAAPCAPPLPPYGMRVVV